MTLNNLVEDYIRTFRHRKARELRFFAIQRSLTDAIEVAALAKLPNGKRHPHQRRIPESSLLLARDLLLKTDVGDCRSFEELHDRVLVAIGPIYRVGPLVVYDTALRIGAYLNLEPAEVFLHAGAQVGARALGLDWKAESLSFAGIPRALRRLRPLEVEDFLCRYKSKLAELGS